MTTQREHDDLDADLIQFLEEEDAKAKAKSMGMQEPAVEASPIIEDLWDEPKAEAPEDEAPEIEDAATLRWPALDDVDLSNAAKAYSKPTPTWEEASLPGNVEDTKSKTVAGSYMRLTQSWTLAVVNLALNEAYRSLGDEADALDTKQLRALPGYPSKDELTQSIVTFLVLSASFEESDDNGKLKDADGKPYAGGALYIAKKVAERAVKTWTPNFIRGARKGGQNSTRRTVNAMECVKELERLIRAGEDLPTAEQVMEVTQQSKSTAYRLIERAKELAAK